MIQLKSSWIGFLVGEKCGREVSSNHWISLEFWLRNLSYMYITDFSDTLYNDHLLRILNTINDFHRLLSMCILKCSFGSMILLVDTTGIRKNWFEDIWIKWLLYNVSGKINIHVAQISKSKFKEYSMIRRNCSPTLFFLPKRRCTSTY